MMCSWLLGWRQAAELCSERWEQLRLPTSCSCNRTRTSLIKVITIDSSLACYLISLNVWPDI